MRDRKIRPLLHFCNYRHVKHTVRTFNAEKGDSLMALTRLLSITVKQQDLVNSYRQGTDGFVLIIGITNFQEYKITKIGSEDRQICRNYPEISVIEIPLNNIVKCVANYSLFNSYSFQQEKKKYLGDTETFFIRTLKMRTTFPRIFVF